MKTSEFIAKYATYMREGEIKNRATCSSVFYDGGKIYSYGWHYPLLYPIQSDKGTTLLCVNRRGYSVTTSKHIGWAGVHADIAVESSSVIANTGEIAAQITHEIEIDQAKYDALKRKNTQKAAIILADIERRKGYMLKLQS